MTDGNHNSNNQASAFEERVRVAMREAEENVSPDVSHRLAAARRSAVAQADAQKPWMWAGVGGALTAGLLVALLVAPQADESLPLFAESEMAAAQDVELLEELEFVAWLVAMEENPDALEQG